MAINAIAVPAPGFSDICATEVKEILGIDASANQGVVSFSAELLQVCEYIYRAQTVERVFLELASCDAGEDIVDKIVPELSKIAPYMPKGATFVVRADVDTQDLVKQELESELGAKIVEKTSAKVNLQRPDVTFIVLVRQGKCHFGIDLSGEDLGKRDFRIFLGPEALKGHVAASLVKMAPVGKVVLDPFCRNGIIPIELALMLTKRSPHYFGKEKFLFRRLPELKDTNWDELFEKIDKNMIPDVDTKIISMDPQFNHISSAKKNAKIAGVNKSIMFSRTDLEFLDAKFGKQAIDTIITLPPQPNVNLPKERIDKMLKDVFYQAEFVMKKGGTMVLITQTGVDDLKKHAAQYGFTFKTERDIKQGKAELKVLVFVR